MTMITVLHDQLGQSETMHGFRKSLSTWVLAETGYQETIANAILAHKLDNYNGAYISSDPLFIKMRAVLNEWGSYCTGRQVSTVSLAVVAA